MIIRSEHIKMTGGKARIYSTGYAAPNLGAYSDRMTSPNLY